MRMKLFVRVIVLISLVIGIWAFRPARLPDIKNRPVSKYQRYKSITPPRVKGAKSNVPEEDNSAAKSAKLSREERLQKVISRAGLASRRDAEELIVGRKVKVNGKVVTELGTKVHPHKDIVTVNGEKATLPDFKELIWIAFNKPKDVLCTMDEEKNRKTLLDYVPQAKDLNLLPVGRMDRTSCGMLLLTNDIGWIHAMTHHSYTHRHKYEVIIEGVLLTKENCTQIEQGLKLPDEHTACGPCTVDIVDVDRPKRRTMLEISLDPTKEDQVERMMAVFGAEVTSLKRIQIGNIHLKGIVKGRWRELTFSEVEQLKKSCVLKKQNRKKADSSGSSSSSVSAAKSIVTTPTKASDIIRAKKASVSEQRKNRRALSAAEESDSVDVPASGKTRTKKRLVKSKVKFDEPLQDVSDLKSAWTLLVKDDKTVSEAATTLATAPSVESEESDIKFNKGRRTKSSDVAAEVVNKFDLTVENDSHVDDVMTNPQNDADEAIVSDVKPKKAKKSKKIPVLESTEEEAMSSELVKPKRGRKSKAGIDASTVAAPTDSTVGSPEVIHLSEIVSHPAKTEAPNVAKPKRGRKSKISTTTDAVASGDEVSIKETLAATTVAEEDVSVFGDSIIREPSMAISEPPYEVVETASHEGVETASVKKSARKGVFSRSLLLNRRDVQEDKLLAEDTSDGAMSSNYDKVDPDPVVVKSQEPDLVTAASESEWKPEPVQPTVTEETVSSKITSYNSDRRDSATESNSVTAATMTDAERSNRPKFYKGRMDSRVDTSKGYKAAAARTALRHTTNSRPSTSAGSWKDSADKDSTSVPVFKKAFSNKYAARDSEGDEGEGGSGGDDDFLDDDDDDNDGVAENGTHFPVLSLDKDGRWVDETPTPSVANPPQIFGNSWSGFSPERVSRSRYEIQPHPRNRDNERRDHPGSLFIPEAGNNADGTNAFNGGESHWLPNSHTGGQRFYNSPHAQYTSSVAAEKDRKGFAEPRYTAASQQRKPAPHPYSKAALKEGESVHYDYRGNRRVLSRFERQQMNSEKPRGGRPRGTRQYITHHATYYRDRPQEDLGREEARREERVFRAAESKGSFDEPLQPWRPESKPWSQTENQYLERPRRVTNPNTVAAIEEAYAKARSARESPRAKSVYAAMEKAARMAKKPHQPVEPNRYGYENRRRTSVDYMYRTGRKPRT